MQAMYQTKAERLLADLSAELSPAGIHAEDRSPARQGRLAVMVASAQSAVRSFKESIDSELDPQTQRVMKDRASSLQASFSHVQSLFAAFKASCIPTERERLFSNSDSVPTSSSNTDSASASHIGIELDSQLSMGRQALLDLKKQRNIIKVPVG